MIDPYFVLEAQYILITCILCCNCIPVLGSWEYSLPSLTVYGTVESNGGSLTDAVTNASVGPGGGSGGTVLLFVRTLTLVESSVLSSVGGFGRAGSGGGGGGRIHFHWSNIPTRDEYVPVAAIEGSILARSDLIFSLIPLLLFWFSGLICKTTIQATLSLQYVW